VSAIWPSAFQRVRNGHYRANRPRYRCPSDAWNSGCATASICIPKHGEPLHNNIIKTCVTRKIRSTSGTLVKP
jgi:hypothetical protein